ncbi:endonuclease/exonuclease/phosphatase family protein [Bacillus sp. FJAT-27251]|uniref:endonuclease/exonuclease/phosphatase family protein n=1 Tax=Bacillus sp. FJAT-27251 TaxID=1684142 RepID=UPI000A3E2137|nr:endonuclease/exonuclease/phosphatase family protein [Bacillus sp. FJAT-27251]
MVIKLRILTFNIHHGRGLDRKVDLDRIRRVIRSGDPDIVGLNEVDKQYSKRSEFVDQAGWLAEKLDMEHVFGPAITLDSQENRQYGNAILSRFPILKSRNHPFDFLPKVVEDRSLLEAEIELGGKPLSLFVAHLSFAPFLHRKQTEFILGKAAVGGKRSVLMGDWNMRPTSKSSKLAASYLQDTNNGQKRNLTYPAKNPRVKLDYIFVSKEFEVLGAETIKVDPAASDHLPLLAVVEV